MMVLRFSMQREESTEHANGKCDVFTFSMQEEDSRTYSCQVLFVYTSLNL